MTTAPGLFSFTENSKAKTAVLTKNNKKHILTTSKQNDKFTQWHREM